MYRRLTSKAGEFRARCNLAQRVPEVRMTKELWLAAQSSGYAREFKQVDSDRVDRETRKHGRWEIVFAACAGFETDDRTAFERHMATEHAGGPMRWDSGWGNATAKTFSPRLAIPVRLRPSRPRRAPAGLLPLVTKAETWTCPDCGLVAEVDGTTASELWTSEHQRGCRLLRAS